MRILWECMKVVGTAEITGAPDNELPKHEGPVARKGHNGNGNGNGNGHHHKRNGNGNGDGNGKSNGNGFAHAVTPDLPPWQKVRTVGDQRCCARRRDGERCNGRVRQGSDYCLFHDPVLTPEQRRAISARGGKCRRRRPRMPKGYPRNLDSLKSVQRAMERLYQELRNGDIDPKAGQSLLKVLCRAAALQESQMPKDAATAAKAEKIADVLAAEEGTEARRHGGTKGTVPAAQSQSEPGAQATGGKEATERPRDEATKGTEPEAQARDGLETTEASLSPKSSVLSPSLPSLVLSPPVSFVEPSA